jgi:hypothetical protein
VSPSFAFDRTSTSLVKILRGFVVNRCVCASRVVDRVQMRALLGISVLLPALDSVYVDKTLLGWY